MAKNKLTLHVNQHRPLPNSNALKRIMELVERTPEAARYFERQFETLLIAAKLQSHEMRTVVNRFTQGVQAQQGNSSLWWQGNGVPLPQDNASNALAKERIRSLSAADVTLTIAISPDAQIKRGYLLDGQAVPMASSEETKLDDVFKFWLSKHGLIYNEQGVYRQTPDEHGHTPMLSGEALEVLMRDPKEGFKAYVKEKNPDLDIRIRYRPYSEETPAMEPARDADVSFKQA